MWNDFLDAIASQLSNQVVAGAIALGLVGVVAVSLRKLPGALTTNHRARLDAALIRPGRIDMEVELGLASAQQMTQRMLRLYPADAERIALLAQQYPPQSLSPAQIQQTLIAADNLAEAEAALRLAFAEHGQAAAA